MISKIKYIFAICYLLFAIPTFAADSSPSANLLDEFNKAVASKAAKLKQEVGLKLQNKAYTGTVKSVTDTSITLASQTGVKIVTINQDTIHKFPLKNLSEEDYVAALGDIDDNGVLTARKLVLLPAPQTPKTYLWGQIVSISDKLLTIQTRDLKTVSVASGSTGDLSIRDFIILTGVRGKNNIFQAGFVYVIPQGGIIKLKKISTPSAKLASPSAKPKR